MQPYEPLEESLKRLEIMLPLKRDKELLEGAKYSLRKWNPKKGHELYLYKKEILSRLTKISFIRGIFFKRKFKGLINNINNAYKSKNIDENILKNEVNTLLKSKPIFSKKTVWISNHKNIEYDSIDKCLYKNLIRTKIEETKNNLNIKNEWEIHDMSIFKILNFDLDIPIADLNRISDAILDEQTEVLVDNLDYFLKWSKGFTKLLEELKESTKQMDHPNSKEITLKEYL